MNNITTLEFIESLNFEYFETYSFQRKGEFGVYETLFERYKNDNDSLSEEETIKLNRLRKSDLYNQKNNFIFTDNDKINETAELIFSSEKFINVKDEIIEILRIPFEDYDSWMCSPIYRDAILFYDSNNKLIDGINICFECCNVIDLNRKEILTDRIVFEKLKIFLQSVGHKIKN